ncbi:hypothetical protein FE784_00680 [Paenibacillus hemerocallicola]|uniref:Uncharacterized protein n=1 Tax=Paenibacillus hemerocallicola TaxID=1172614 RepID=A0A5C4THI8_9BACL|nr:hypothetical protein [Paenibacillus hemerocallicola]TNJ68212.1 hypothetical protein FE784_00680 [Paenibacillus hemerocallicola]
MSFRFDRQHLTGQQQAIAAQRDRADAEAKKKSAETQISKVELLKNFIGQNQVFDLVITKHEHEGSLYGNHYSEVVNIHNDEIVVPGIGFKGSIMEKLITTIAPNNAKISFFDSDGIEIKLSIIKRAVKAP